MRQVAQDVYFSLCVLYGVWYTYAKRASPL